MKTILPILLVATLFPSFSISTANAQDSDLLGVFFDASGGQSSIETTQPYEVIPFYIILLEPSHEEGIHAWECVLEGITGEGPALMVNWVMAGGAFNAAQFPALLAILSTPLPPAASVVLASGEVLVPEPETEILFYLHPYYFPSLDNPPDGGYPVTTPLYAYGEDLYQPLGWTSGCEAEPLAWINDDGEDPSWSIGDLPEELFFGYVPAGETATRGFYLQNTGEVTLSGQLSISGEGFRYCYLYNGDYPYGLWTSDTQWFRMEPGQGSYVELRLESATDEGYEGALDLTLCGETTTIPLVMGGPPQCVISPLGWDFGDVLAGDSGQQIFEVQNVGGSPLEGQVTIPESCSGFTVVEGAEPFSLGHDETHSFTVEFNPVESGAQECHALVSAECEGIELVGFCLVPTEDCWYYQAGNGPIVGSVETPGYAAADVAVAGNYAYIADYYSGLQVIDISVPETPEIVGAVDTLGLATGVAVAGSYACVTQIVWPWGGRIPHPVGSLQVVDISDPESPTIVGAVETPSPAFDLAVAGSYAFLTDDFGLQVIDISDPALPVIVSTVDPPTGLSRYNGVAVAGNYAYVTAICFYGCPGPGQPPPPPCRNFQVIDISVPEAPVIVGIVYEMGNVERLAVSGNYAYVVDNNFLHVIDISGPESPTIVGAVETPRAANDVAVAGNYAYLADYDDLQVIDISVPEFPEIVGAAVTPDAARGVAVAGNYAYLADNEAGLQIAWQQCDDGVVATDDDLEETAPDDGVPAAGLRIAVHPNPFNPRTTISFALDHPQNVELCVFDLTGKRIAVLSNRAFEAGQHSMEWEGRDTQGNAVASGTYLVRMVSDEGVATEKMMLIR